MENSIIAQLKVLGLSDREAAVYAALLVLKNGTALTVAQSAGIKRPTAYFVLESLCQKKLVAVTKFRNVRDYRALPLEHLRNYISKQKKLADDYLPTIQKLYNERPTKLRLRVYHNLSDIKTLLEKSLREKSILHIIGERKIFEQNLGAYWQYFIKRAGQLNIMPLFKHHSSSVSLLLWSDKVAFIEMKNQPQVFGFKNCELHDYYQKIWNRY